MTTDPDLAGAIGDQLAARPPLDIETAWLRDLTATVQRATPPGDRRSCAEHIAAISELRRVLNDYAADVADAMYPLLPADETVIYDDLGGFTRTFLSDKVRWDNPGLLRLVLDSQRTAPDGTRIDETPVEKVVRVWTMPPSRGPSTKALKEYGIDRDALDEFRTREGGRRTVKYEPTIMAGSEG